MIVAAELCTREALKEVDAMSASCGEHKVIYNR